jgi:1-acyl-sn-glycerol-3-phosphate acyltransferase
MTINMRVFIKSLLIITCILGFALAATLLKPFKVKNMDRLMQTCFRTLLKIIGVRYTVKGAPSGKRPLLLVTNHSTYLDILIIGAELPVRFTPKAEIGKWPGIGWLCRLTQCVFIDRRASQTAANLEAMRAELRKGEIICLFPEGTTNDGKRVLPFRSSYFSLAEENFAGAKLAVQPAAVRYTRIMGLPIDSAQLPRLAWYGDMELVPHIGELLKLGPIEAEVIYGEPVDRGAFPNRKALAAHCHAVIDAEVKHLKNS